MRELDDRIVRAIIGAIRQQDRSGYEIWRWLGATHGDHGTELTEATLYPVLHELETRHVLLSEWNEDASPRLHYRVASKGAMLAERRGWPTLRHPIAADPLATTQPGAEDSAQAPLPADVDEYVRRLDTRVNLSDDRRTLVRNEIRDHLEDASREYRRLGREPAEATACAIAGLGSPELLGDRITKAELSRDRLLTGSRRAVVTALFGAVIGLGVAGVSIFAAPIVAHMVAIALTNVGVHLYMPNNQGWFTEQVSLILDLAMFFAARRSTPAAAEWTRRSLRSIKPIWGFGGAAILTVAVLFVPTQLDPLSALTYLMLPVGWLLGTWRCQRPGDDLISRRGIVQTAPIIAVLLFIPGVRVWVFDPSSAVSQPLPAAASDISVILNPTTGAITTSGEDPRYRDLRIEAWPATREVFRVVPDRTATLPTFSFNPGSAFLASSLPDSTQDWWLVLVGVGAADGSAHRLDVTVLPAGEKLRAHSIAGWLLGDR